MIVVFTFLREYIFIFISTVFTKLFSKSNSLVELNSFLLSGYGEALNEFD